MCMGVAVIVTACVGVYGEKQDNKCLLLLVRSAQGAASMARYRLLTCLPPLGAAPLQYFLVLTFSFLVLIVMGAIATFDKGTINQKFSSWWDKYPEAAAKVRRAAQWRLRHLCTTGGRVRPLSILTLYDYAHRAVRHRAKRTSTAVAMPT